MCLLPKTLLSAVMAAFVAALPAMLAPGQATADDGKSEMEYWSKKFEVRGGPLVHDSGYLLDGGPRNDVYAINAEFLFPSPDFLSVLFHPRPKIGFSLAPDADGISFAYAGLNWDIPVYRGFFLTAGLGGSINNADVLTERDLGPNNSKKTDRLVGCRALFHLSAGIGYRFNDALSAHFYGDHISNANLCDNNEGLDQWGIRLGYAF